MTFLNHLDTSLLAPVQVPLAGPTLHRRRTDRAVEPGDFATRLIACPPSDESSPYPWMCERKNLRPGKEL
jgi:hypothetical protein